jgi:hypothetical protein
LGVFAVAAVVAAAAAVDGVLDVAACVEKYAVLERFLVEAVACTGVDRMLPVTGK